MSAGHTEGELGRFRHHPDPVIDFEIEVEEIESILIDCEYGLRDWRAERLDERSSKAFNFISVSADGQKAKLALRDLYPRLRAVIRPRAIEAAEADLLGRALAALRALRPSNLGRVPESMRDDETLPVDMTIREIRMIDAILSQAREVKA